jgi:hypothetical protein
MIAIRGLIALKPCFLRFSGILETIITGIKTGKNNRFYKNITRFHSKCRLFIAGCYTIVAYSDSFDKFI